MNHDQALAWINARIAQVPESIRGHEDAREYLAGMRDVRDLLYVGRANGQVVAQLAPLCPCTFGPEADGPERQCPIHGDGQTFVAIHRWRDALVIAATGVRDTERAEDTSALDRMIDLLDGGPFAGHAPKDAEPRHEVECPSCGATIRARMADAPAAQVTGAAAELEIEGRGPRGSADPERAGWF